MCIPSIEARSTERGYESIVKYCFFIVLVLIDTWWNVNDKVYTIYNADGVGFNRYMVECEYTKKLENNKRVFRFNRYMVECE